MAGDNVKMYAFNTTPSVTETGESTALFLPSGAFVKG
jgi:hypothetical protein